MEKLASCQKITNITTIEGADKIETLWILGWNIVARKGEFKIGDLCCYIQIDTILPETEQFEFLRERKFRCKTIKLRGQISQGLVIPLPEGIWNEGEDLTEIIGVKKYEKVDNNPEKYEKIRMPKIWYKKLFYIIKYNYLYKIFPNIQPKFRSPFPTQLVGITNEERIQNCPETLQTHKGKEFIVSLKCDGSSITLIHNKVFGKSKIRICSRKFELHDKKNDWYRVYKDTNFKEYIIRLVKYYKTNDIIVQGEAIGKFNGNHHNLQYNEIRLFNIYVNGKRINQKEFYDACINLNIPTCPFLGNIILNHSLEEILKLSEIKDLLNPKVPAEGLVWRCISDNTSFKVINNQYLLQEK